MPTECTCDRTTFLHPRYGACGLRLAVLPARWSAFLAIPLLALLVPRLRELISPFSPRFLKRRTLRMHILPGLADCVRPASSAFPSLPWVASRARMLAVAWMRERLVSLVSGFFKRTRSRR